MSTPLVVIAGNEQVLTFPVMNIAQGVSITGAQFTVLRFVGDGTPVLQKALGSGITETGNTLLVTLLEGDLGWIETLYDTGFFYDLQVELSDGSGPYTAAKGRLRVRPRITQTP